MTVFVTDVRYGERLWQVRKEIFGDNFPGSAMVTITALANPDAKIETRLCGDREQIEAASSPRVGFRDTRAGRGWRERANSQRQARGLRWSNAFAFARTQGGEEKAGAQNETKEANDALDPIPTQIEQYCCCRGPRCLLWSGKRTRLH
jgi:hypothetical protein